MKNQFLALLDFFAVPLALHFSSPKTPVQTYTPPAPPPPTPPPAPPAPKAATAFVRDDIANHIPKRGRRSTFLTANLPDMTDQRRSLLGSQMFKPNP